MGPDYKVSKDEDLREIWEHLGEWGTRPIGGH